MNISGQKILMTLRKKSFRRILLAYENAKIKPKFEITDNVISVILPVITNQYHITSDEEKIINVLENGKQLSSSEIVKATGYTKSKVLRLIVIKVFFFIREGVLQNRRNGSAVANGDGQQFSVRGI